MFMRNLGGVVHGNDYVYMDKTDLAVDLIDRC